MRNNNTLFITLLIIMIIPQIGMSQTINKRSNNLQSVDEQTWMPINEFPDYQNVMQTSPTDVGTPVITNIKNGVSFYNKRCNTDVQTLLIKLVNLNNYPVKVSWQISPRDPIVSVVVLAQSEIEGSCSLTDDNSTKLKIQFPVGVDNEEIKKYILTHLSVIEE